MPITPTEYAAAMRRLETMRNEALRHADRFALRDIARRAADLNDVFFGRNPEAPRREAGGPAES